MDLDLQIASKHPVYCKILVLEKFGLGEAQLSKQSNISKTLAIMAFPYKWPLPWASTK